MAKKKVPINEKVKTRKDEIRFKTDDPKRMLNKYICARVLKAWTEDFVDKDTGQITSVERNEVLFEKGTYIDREVLQKIQFSQAAGECKEIEVSNQNREAYELESTHLYPYSSKVTVGDKKYRFILYATSIQNVLEIMRDYLELNYSGGFSITNVQEMDSCIILTDELTKENLDIAYLRDGIDMETYLNARQGPDESEDGNAKEEKKFFQMDMKITYDDGIELHQSFIVNTFDTKIVLSTILRAGLPLHDGMLSYFDNAESAFLAAYRKYDAADKFHINTEYCTTPDLEGKTLIIADAMLATGSSIILVYDRLISDGGQPDHTHIVCPIVSAVAVDTLKKALPANTTLWTGAVDEELTSHSFVVPGLGDAGDLAYGEKI